MSSILGSTMPAVSAKDHDITQIPGLHTGVKHTIAVADDIHNTTAGADDSTADPAPEAGSDVKEADLSDIIPNV